MLKFYVLWSRDIDNLKRSTSIIPKDQLVVIINSLDNLNISVGVQYCSDNQIEFQVTKSDGTPATGKNSVLKHFLNNPEATYMVAIDGDDYLTPYGVKVYQELADHPEPPDMVVLYRQLALKGGDPSLFTEPQAKQRILDDYLPSFPFDKSIDVGLNYKSLYEMFRGWQYNETHENAHNWAEARVEVQEIVRTLMECWEAMCRMVWHSKEVAKVMHYDNSIIVGEDTLQFLKLKKIALVNQSLRIYRRKERNIPTYIYDNSDDKDSVMAERRYDWDWMRPFIDAIHNDVDYKDFPKYKNLPEFLDDDWIRSWIKNAIN